MKPIYLLTEGPHHHMAKDATIFTRLYTAKEEAEYWRSEGLVSHYPLSVIKFKFGKMPCVVYQIKGKRDA